MSLNKLLGLARSIVTDIVAMQGMWLDGQIINDNDEGDTMEDALQAEVDGYVGQGFISNWIIRDDAILQGYTRQIMELDLEDREELETMIRDLAVDYLATGKIM